MRQLRRTIGIGAGLQHCGLLTVIGNVQLAGHQHHALGGSMPVQRQHRFTRHFEKNINIIRRRITMKYRYGAALRHE